MSAILYDSTDSFTKGRLKKIIKAEVSDKEIEIVRTMEELCQHLCQPNRGNKIAVLCVADTIEFYRLLAIKKSLKDIRIILVLPDRSAEMISAGHKLHPRFISYADSDFKDIAVVLKRMMKIVEKGGEATPEAPFFFK